MVKLQGIFHQSWADKIAWEESCLAWSSSASDRDPTFSEKGVTGKGIMKGRESQVRPWVMKEPRTLSAPLQEEKDFQGAMAPISCNVRSG